MNDRIRVNGLQFYSHIFGSPWSSIDDYDREHARLQPVVISVEAQLDIQDAGLLDDLTHSIDYSQLSKKVRDACYLADPEGPVFGMPYDLAERILEFCLKEFRQQTRQFVVELEFPKLILRAKSVGVKLTWNRDGATPKKHSFFISELPVHTIIGLRPHERKDKQTVIISFQFDSAKPGYKNLHFDFSKLESRISNFVEGSAYLTIEALTVQIARECFAWLEDPAQYSVTVSVAKPAAVSTAQASEVQITRKLSDFPPLVVKPSREAMATKTLVALCLGANLGDRFQNIELALRHLEDVQSLSIPGVDLRHGELRVIDTSFLYESAPMYVETQPAFINCACLVETTFGPYDLLRICKHIEKTVGRVPSERYGPRAVDLDIVTFGEQVIDSRAPESRSSLDNLEGQLVIPHPRMAEREFVLRPLKDIIPEWIHPQFHLTTRSLFAKLLLGQSSTLERVVPFPLPFSPEQKSRGELRAPSTQTYWILPDPNATRLPPRRKRDQSERRYIMATLNVTPDSFSDGGEHNALVDALAYAREAVDAGADIIDIGGYSTRPGAADIPPSEEIARIVPVIRAIRADDQLSRIPISIDTFRAEVARAALDVGANCINDVYAFCGGPEYYFPSSFSSPSTIKEESDARFTDMQSLAHERGVPVVMMHSRGYANQNKDYSSYSYSSSASDSESDGGVIEGVRFELAATVLRATKGGPGALRRWQVIIDPGIGFSKDVEGNLQLLRNASSLNEDGFVPPGVRPSSSDIESETHHLYPNPYITPNWNPLAGYPLVIGTSRKSFLGTLLAEPFSPANSSSPFPSTREQEQDSQQAQQNKGQGQGQGQEKGELELQQRSNRHRLSSPPPPPPPRRAPQQQLSPYPPRPPKERDFATATAVACAVQQGAAIVRVHAVKEMADVVKVAAALR